MSQKEVQDKKYWNEIHAVTRNISKLIKIEWTIENVSTNVGTSITGPDFYFDTNCLCSISFEISDYHRIYMVNKSNVVKIRKHLKCLDCSGTLLYEETMGQIYTLNQNSSACIACVDFPKSKSMSLKEDKMIIHCLIKVEGRSITKINFYNHEIESLENLVDDWKKMFKNPLESDFTLQVEDKVIHAHKALLLARSVYFRRMFETEMKEQSEKTVLITDVSYQTMEKLVEFLYTGCFPEVSEHNELQQISDLYFAADKYEVMDLRALCGERLLSNATANNVCQTLQLAQRHGDDKLKMRAMDAIFFLFDKVEKSKAWQTFISSDSELASEVLNYCFKHFK